MACMHDPKSLIHSNDGADEICVKLGLGMRLAGDIMNCAYISDDLYHFDKHRYLLLAPSLPVG